MKTNPCAYMLTLALGLASVACGSEDPPSTMVPGETLDYYPLVDGRQMVYYHSSNNGWDETLTVTQASDGSFLESDTANPDGIRSETMLTKDAAGRIIRHHKDQFLNEEPDISVDYADGTYGGFLRYDPAWAAMEVGESVTVDYNRTETPAGGSPDPVRARSHIYYRHEIETITLAATGETFRDCLKIRRARNYNDVLGEAEDQEKMFWFAPGIGKVQEQTLIGGSGSEQLIEYPEQGN